MRLDLFFFGVHPSIWLQRLVRPWLTDLMAVAYASYYFIPFTLIVMLYRKNDEGFLHTIVTLLLGYYLSYVGYLIVPAIGPRYTLSHLYSIPLRGAVAEGIIGFIDALEGNKWNCFPSGHVQITLLSLWFAYIYTQSVFWVYLPVVAALILSTIYLRYHYVADVVAGIAFAVVTVVMGGAFLAWWRPVRVSDRSGRSYIPSPPWPLRPSA